jgi:flagellar basal body-associated protein FliL
MAPATARKTIHAREWNARRWKLAVIVALIALPSGVCAAATALTADGGEPARITDAAIPEARLSSGVFHDLPDILVDIRGRDAARPVLKLRVSVELGHKRDIQALQRANPRILDSLITTLRTLPVDDLEGPGLQRMQGDILDIVRRHAPSAGVRSVRFKEVAVQ